ncbi:hypothetical protein B7463_g7277, partial [Scytalidium lignicola]
MNQDLETGTPVDNNNEQQPEEGSEEGSEEESEEGSEEVSEESSEDSSEEDQGENQTIEETNIQEGVLEEVVMPPKQPARSTEGSAVGESSRASGKKPVPPLPKSDPEPVPRAPSPDPDPDSEPEDDVEQVPMATPREVKIARPDLFYGDRKKLKAYLAQTGTYLVLNDHLLPGDTHKVLWASTYLRGVAETWFQPFKDEWFATNGGTTNQGVRNILGSWENYTGELKRLYGDVDEKRNAERRLAHLRQTKSPSEYAMLYRQHAVSVNWGEEAHMHQFRIGLKDSIKEELYRRPAVNKLDALIDLAIKIGNEQYEMILDKKGGSYFNRRKSDGKKDRGDPMELDAMKKGKTFKGKGKKHYEGKSKKGNSFGISSEELDRRRKNKLCFKCGLPGHMANTHKKDNKSSAAVRVGAMRIPRIMDISSESSEEESSNEEEERPNLVTIPEITVEADADEMAMASILETGSVPMRRTRRMRHPRNQGEAVSPNRWRSMPGVSGIWMIVPAEFEAIPTEQYPVSGELLVLKYYLTIGMRGLRGWEILDRSQLYRTVWWEEATVEERELDLEDLALVYETNLQSIVIKKGSREFLLPVERTRIQDDFDQMPEDAWMVIEEGLSHVVWGRYNVQHEGLPMITFWQDRLEAETQYGEIWGLGKSVEQLPEAEQYHVQQERREPVRIVVEQANWDVEALPTVNELEEDSLPLEAPIVLPGEDELLQGIDEQFNQEVAAHPLNSVERIPVVSDVSITEIRERLGDEMAEWVRDARAFINDGSPDGPRLRNLAARRTALFEELQENAEDLEIEDDVSVDSAGNVNLYSMNSESSLYIDITLCGKPVKALIDSGAERNFISEQVVKRLGLSTRVKNDSYLISLANGTKVQKRVDVQTRNLDMRYGRSHQEKISFDVTRLGTYQVILGIEWMRKHNPIIDWRTGMITFPEETVSLGAVHVDETMKHIPGEYYEWLELFTERPDDSALPEHKPWDHEIKLKEGFRPAYGPIYRTTLAEDEATKKWLLEKMVPRGLYREGHGEAGAPLHYARKGDDPLGRPCGDYRHLNSGTEKDRYPLPLIDSMMDKLKGAVIFTKLDLWSAFNLVRIKRGDEWKAAIRTKYGLFEPLVMTFGMTNAPATQQRMMDRILEKYLEKFVMVYLDDIIIYSKSIEEHKEHVKLVLQALWEAGLRCKPVKCEFYKEQVQFLGHRISGERIETLDDKIQSIKEWETPKTVKQLQSFLGLANYYRRFVKDYSKISAPLTELTKKDQAYQWNDSAKEAFQSIKDAFVKGSFLGIFDPEKGIRIETDASDVALGAVLSQSQQIGKRHYRIPLAFWSRKLNAAERNYQTSDKEMLAIVEALKHWRVYAVGSSETVDILSDHHNLQYFMTTKQLNARQARWAEKLSEYDFKITHVKGEDNGRADALSRKPEYSAKEKEESEPILKEDEEGFLIYNRGQLMAITAVTDKHWADLISEATEREKEQNALPDMTRGEWEKIENIWYKNKRLYIPTKLAEEFVREQHGLPYNGHMGVARCYYQINKDYFIVKLRSVVKKVIAECEICGKAKNPRRKPWGQLHPTQIPDNPWELIGWDFIVKLPVSTDRTTKIEYDSIFVVTEHRTNYATFEPFRETWGAEEVADIFLRRIVSQWGLPKQIISDRDTRFTSKFWETLTARMGVKRKLSTAWHPQTDGKTERLNGWLEGYLRCYVNYDQDNWVDYLPMAEMAYNGAPHESTRITPFYANYGREPEGFRTGLELESTSESAEIRAKQMEEMQERIGNSLQYTKERMKKYHDRGRLMEPAYKKGDKVYLLRRNIKTTRPSDKLDWVKMGPYEIEEVYGPLTYKLKLPTTVKIHPVFHVSLLEPAPENAQTPMLEEVDPEREYEVEKIISHRMHYGKLQYLVKWIGYPESENGWEPTSNLTSCEELLEAYQRTHPRTDFREMESRGQRRRGQQQRKKPRLHRQNATLQTVSLASLSLPRRRVRPNTSGHDGPSHSFAVEEEPVAFANEGFWPWLLLLLLVVYPWIFPRTPSPGNEGRSCPKNRRPRRRNASRARTQNTARTSKGPQRTFGSPWSNKNKGPYYRRCPQ